MNEQIRDTAALYVLDLLAGEERERFEAAVRSDDALAAYVSELREGAARKHRSLPQHEPPSGALGRIEERIPVRGGEHSRRPGRAPLRLPALAGWIGAAACLAAAAFVAGRRTAPPAGGDALLFTLGPGSSTSVPVAIKSATSDGRFMELAALAESMAARAAGGGAVRAYALYDPKTSLGFIAISGLPPAAGAERYSLWAVDGRQGPRTLAGELPPDARGFGIFGFSLRDHPSASDVNFFVTRMASPGGSQDGASGASVVLGSGRG